MVWFCFGKENNSSRRVILKIELRIKQPKLNHVTVGRDSSFPYKLTSVVTTLLMLSDCLWALYRSHSICLSLFLSISLALSLSLSLSHTHTNYTNQAARAAGGSTKSKT